MRPIDADALAENIRGLLYEPDSTQYVWSSDVLAAIRKAPTVAEEPRVLTLEEVQNNCPDYVYLEWLNCCICCIKDEGESNKSVGYFAYGIEGNYNQFLWNLYGVRWRCWTAMPTGEQRKAVKWSDTCRR